MKIVKAVFLLIIFLLNTSCLLEDALKLPFNGFDPKNISDGWTISSPEAEGIDALQLTGVFKNLHENDIWQIKSLLVFKNGKLVAESYMKDTNEIVNKTAVWSCTKQFTAILTGIAVDQGLFTVDDPVSNYLPAAVSYGKGHITIKIY
jgi:hypothetical protein